MRRIKRILYQFKEAERYTPDWKEIATVVFSFGVFENVFACLAKISFFVVAPGKYDTINPLKLKIKNLVTFTLHQRYNPSTLRLDILNNAR